MTRENMINELDKVMNDLYAKVGTDSYVWRCQLYDIREALCKNQIPLSSPSSATAEEPYRCPVCGGNGLVPNGFYCQTSGDWPTTSISPEVCRSCNGTGVIFAAQQVAEATKDVTKQRDELREELELCTQSVRKGAMVTSGLTGRTGWKFDIDSNKKAVDEYLKSRDSHE